MSQRRIAAVLFADVVSSTPIAERLDPEDVRALFDRYYRDASRVVHAAGGRVEKFIGDAVVGLFGAADSTGRDAEQAVRAAIALRAAVRRDAQLLGLIELRIGVALGEIVTGTDPTSEAVASGDVINTAARIMSVAEPNEILVSARLRNAIEPTAVVGAVKFLSLRGKQHVAEVYPVLGLREGATTDNLPFVGRQTELGALADAADRARQFARPVLVTMIGPVGIGKSRLLDEFSVSTPSDDTDLAVRIRFSPADRIATEACFMRLAVGLLGPRWERELRVALPGENSELLGAAISASSRHRSSSARIDANVVSLAWRGLIQAVGRTRRLTLILRDAQWAPESFLDVVEKVTTSGLGCHLLVLCTATPEFLIARSSWGRSAFDATRLLLAPLADRDIAKLLDSWPVTDAGLRATVVTRASGNPLYAQEFCRYLDHLTANGAEAPEIPDTVHAAIMARLDPLPPPAIETLTRITVFGRRGTGAQLQRYLVQAGRPDQVRTSLDVLLDLAIIRRVADGMIVVTDEIVRDVVLSRITNRQEIALRAEAASVLRSCNGAEQLVAYHLGRCLALWNGLQVRPEPLFDINSAVEYIAEYADQVYRSGAISEAQTMMSLACLSATPDRAAGFSEALGDMLGWTRAAFDAYRQAYESVDRSRTSAVVRLSRKLAMLVVRAGLPNRSGPTMPDLGAFIRSATCLAAHSGQTDELARLRLAEVFRACSEAEVGATRTPLWSSMLETAERAVDRFTATDQTTIELSEALDACQAVAAMCGERALAHQFALRRLAVKRISSNERADVVSIAANSIFEAGRPHDALALIRGTQRTEGAVLGPGRVAAILSTGIAIAQQSGSWHDLDELHLHNRELFEELSSSVERADRCVPGLFSALQVAAARMDRAATQDISGLLLAWAASDPALLEKVRMLIHIECARAPTVADVDINLLATWSHLIVGRFNFAGVIVPEGWLTLIPRGDPAIAGTRCAAIARALRNGDADRLESIAQELANRCWYLSAARARCAAARICRVDPPDDVVEFLTAVGDRRTLLQGSRAPDFEGSGR